MCDDDIHVGLVYDPKVSRRTFGVLTAAAAGGVATGAYAADVVEKDVEVKTADGVADAALFHPAGKGTWPAVLIWTDIAGLRPAFREMGRRLAGQGYVVLVPNPFYRSVKGVVATPGFDFSKPEDRARVMGYRGAMSNAGIDSDAQAYVAFLDAQPQTSKKKKVGVQGYCMGGPLSFRTAAAVPGRIGAVGSFHGGGLTTKTPDSPHLLIPKTNAGYLVAVAQNDDKAQPDSKDILKAAFAEAKKTATVEVYAANHGWCVKGSQVYNEAEAERAWAELSKLYKAKLG
ncbi:MAG: dienelactone hydrolase family protein [Phenylobacterium sp.]|uniref:dienelactone hydrolase family protein n=1 Tax=Phenylobacterium sp. TaxID=1871053 RepID=UPI0011FA97DB|nr:dienelactone hydrolase family protein [Phenylobacterium sp.]TAL30859.1 MAG: dienelactone hydrolase family protein [Phenylobacterium sp.]